MQTQLQPEAESRLASAVLAAPCAASAAEAVVRAGAAAARGEARRAALARCLLRPPVGAQTRCGCEPPPTVFLLGARGEAMP